jgi:hypothetical protein
MGLFKYIEITAITGYDPMERATAISEQLYFLGVPPSVRNPEDVSIQMFEPMESAGKIYLQILLDYPVYVHPDNDIAGLAGLFPGMSPEEKVALIEYIETNNYFPFKNIIPAGTVIYDEI